MPWVLALVVLAVGASVTAYLVSNSGDEEAASDTTGDDNEDVSTSSLGPPPGTASERIEALLKDEPAVTPPPADLSALAGVWQGTIVAMEALNAEHAVPLDIENAPPLAFNIQQDGDSFVMESTDQTLPRRTLEVRDGQIVGQGPSPLVLALQGDVLVGTITNEHWRLEFHASRQP